MRDAANRKNRPAPDQTAAVREANQAPRDPLAAFGASLDNRKTPAEVPGARCERSTPSSMPPGATQPVSAVGRIRKQKGACEARFFRPVPSVQSALRPLFIRDGEARLPLALLLQQMDRKSADLVFQIDGDHALSLVFGGIHIDHKALACKIRHRTAD